MSLAGKPNDIEIDATEEEPTEVISKVLDQVEKEEEIEAEVKKHKEAVTAGGGSETLPVAPAARAPTTFGTDEPEEAQVPSKTPIKMIAVKYEPAKERQYRNSIQEKKKRYESPYRFGNRNTKQVTLIEIKMFDKRPDVLLFS